MDLIDKKGKKNVKNSASLLILVATLSACSIVPKHSDFLDSVKQETESIKQWENLTNQTAGEEKTATLNQLIETPELDLLLSQALVANPSLQQTLLTLQIQQAEQRQAFGQRLPQVDAGYNVSKVKSPTTITQNAGTQYIGSLNISWQVDLWGKLANSDYAQRKAVEQQAWLFQAARDSLVAQVGQAWLGLINQRHQIEVYEKNVESLRKKRQFVAERYRAGLGLLEDLDSVQTNLASAKATLESAKQTLAQQQRTLAMLIGRPHTEQLPVAGSYPEVLTPITMLPAQTLQRRPDLQAAYIAIQAANLRSKVAYKDLLPSINLTAALQDFASSPSQALLKNPLWSLLAQLTAPLYQGGQLKAAAEISDLQVAQAYQSYRGTLLTAVNEVEDALSLQHSLVIQYQHVSDAVNSAERNLKQYRLKYRAGLVTILDVLNVEQQMFALLVQKENLLFQQLSNRVTLSLALGLRWQAPDQQVDAKIASLTGALK